MKLPIAEAYSGVNSLKILVQECDRQLLPTTRTTMSELAELQRRAIFCMLQIGPACADIRVKVEELQFQPGMPPIWVAVETGEISDLPIVPHSWPQAGPAEISALMNRYLEKVLSELRELLLIAKRRTKERISTPKGADQNARFRFSELKRACVRCRGKRTYIESICKQLQQAKAKMPPRWIKEWEAKGFRVEQHDWLLAYKETISRPKVQKSISKTCRNILSRLPTS